MQKYLVAVATYRRPGDLKRLLDSLESIVSRDDVEVLVVDNDADSSARLVASEHALRPRYEIEPVPGIASARNRALDSFTEEFAAIVFIDDDEWVDLSWFDSLVDYASRTGADVVQGPVITVLPDEAPRWIRDGRFFQRHIMATGTPLSSAATNNVLLTRRAWVSAGSPRFDQAFSTTGGSDFDLFWGIGKAGALMLYCAGAIVFEDVPQSRLSWAWLRRRYTRIGIGILNSRRKHNEPMFRFLAVRFGALIAGLTQLLFDVLRGRGPHAGAVERIFKSWGVFVGLTGYRIHEYSR